MLARIPEQQPIRSCPQRDAVPAWRPVEVSRRVRGKLHAARRRPLAQAPSTSCPMVAPTARLVTVDETSLAGDHRAAAHAVGAA
jgi:hypothetical protein